MTTDRVPGSETTEPPAPDDASIIGRVDSIRVELDQLDLERRFRSTRGSEQRVQVAIGLGVVAFAMLAFAFSDAAFVGIGRRFVELLSLRLAVAMSAGAVIVAIRRGARVELVDRAVLAWWMLFAVCMTTIDASRPPTYVLHVTMDVLTVLTAYLLPTRFPFQLASGLAITIGSVAVLLTRKVGLAPMQIALFATAYLYATILGIALARHHHQSTRERFLVDERVQRARTELRALRQLVPVCAGCKAVKDPNGEWHRIEEFLSNQTGSEITHGLCPDCVRVLYPGIAERVLSRRPN